MIELEEIIEVHAGTPDRKAWRSVTSGGIMRNRIQSNLVVAVCTGVALIVLALLQREGVLVRVSATELFVAAAVICLLPVGYALVRCRSLQQWISNAAAR